MSTILHITTRNTWEQAQRAGEYRADSLATEGFIHCSTPAQVVRVANALYRDQAGLVLLYIDPARLRSALRYETPSSPQAGPAEHFPHLYGPLNLDAVIRVEDFTPGADGLFSLPG